MSSVVLFWAFLCEVCLLSVHSIILALFFTFLLSSPKQISRSLFYAFGLDREDSG